jgi:hypothetical protein
MWPNHHRETIFDSFVSGGYYIMHTDYETSIIGLNTLDWFTESGLNGAFILM